MKFLLIGCNGKMGKTVANIVSKHNDEISCGIDISSRETTFNTYTNTNQINEEFDAIIDFSTTPNHIEFINFAVQKKVPYGLFSTVINDESLNALKNAGKAIPVLHSKNSSIGINLLYELINLSAQHLTNCDCAITEYHHKQKIDAPSGTAKEIEKILLCHNIPYTTSSFRVANEKGTHKIEFFLEDEKLTIEHHAYSRDIFANGAIQMMHKLNKYTNGFFEKI